MSLYKENFLPLILFNGNIQNYERMKDGSKVELEERGLQFGDGVYEVVRIYNGEYFLLKEHIDRLFRSMEAIKLESPFSSHEITEWFEQLIHANEFTGDGIIYFQISRGVQSRNHVFNKNTIPTFYGYIIPKERPINDMEQGVSACVMEDIRWLRCNIKSLNLIPNLLAKNEAHENGFFEAILVRDGSLVTEGSLSNVFIVKDKRLFTHPANNLILEGITRNHVIQLAKKNGYTVIEDQFTLLELENADEVFLTGTTVEVMPITYISNSLVTRSVGEVTKHLQKLYSESL